MELSNNTILITGGGSGIGFAMARQLLQLGNKVIICGRDFDRLKKAKQIFTEIEIIRCDISKENSVQALVQEIQHKYPDLNFLVNNAGIMRMWNIQKETTSIAEQKQEILTNLFGTIQVTQSLIPQLLTKENSIILNVSSALAFAPISAAPVYNATKAALHSYSISIRQQLQHTNVRVVELLPAAIQTDMANNIETIVGKENSGSKMTAEKLAQLTMKGLKNDKYEIRPGMANALYVTSRIFPALAQKILQRQARKILIKL